MYNIFGGKWTSSLVHRVQSTGNEVWWLQSVECRMKRDVYRVYCGEYTVESALWRLQNIECNVESEVLITQWTQCSVESAVWWI